MLSDKEYIENAVAAVQGAVDIPADSAPVVERRPDTIVVTFPADLPQGSTGPAYYAQVFLDPETGEFQRGMVGS